MKLELKHYLPYLPHKLRVQSIGIFQDDPTFELTINRNGDVRKFANLEWVLNDSFKPILKPLIEMFDCEEVTDQFSDNELEDFKWHFLAELIPINRFDYLTVNQMDVIVKNHYDIFGLLKEGLATNYNTLNQDESKTT